MVIDPRYNNTSDQTEHKIDDIYSVLVSMQKDGGGEWIDPEFRGLFETEDHAIEFAKRWADSHIGNPQIYKCTLVKEVILVNGPSYNII